MGTFTPKLDEKGRLFLPAKFRDRLSGGLVITQGHEACLAIFPQDVFEVEAQKIGEAPMTSREDRDYERMFFSAAEDSVPDKQGRLMIPPPLREYAGLERDAVVIGAMSRVEIWEPGRWREYSGVTRPKYSDIDRGGTRT